MLKSSFESIYCIDYYYNKNNDNNNNNNNNNYNDNDNYGPGAVYEFVYISFRTGNLKCFKVK